MTTKSAFRFGSVCSGIEAASVALHPLGWSAAWLSEIDAFPSAVLAHRFPDVPNLGDMTGIAARVLSGEVEAPDALIGGTPCQAFSVAGMRGGLSDARGQLTLSYVELANAIDTTRAISGRRPAVIWWENVPGVFSSKDNAFGCFLGGLAGESSELQPPGGKWKDAGCVFGPQRTVAWRVLDAQYFGLAQRRRRVFVVASADPRFNPAAVLFELEGMRRDSPPSREAGEEAAGTLAARTDGGGFPGTDEACSGYVQPSSVTVMAHGQGGAEISVDRSPTLTCNHEAPIASYAIQAGALRTNPASGPDGVGVQSDVAYTLEARAEVQCTAYAFQPRNGRGAMGDVVNALTAQAGETGKGDAAPCVAVCIHGTQDPDIRIDHAHALGRNSGQENVVCVTGDVTHTLRAEGFDASEDGTGRGQPIVAAFAENSRAEVRYEGGDDGIVGALNAGGGKPGQGHPAVQIGTAVRRLLPVECERLQGFPDNWTLIPSAKLNRLIADELAFLRLFFPDMPEAEAHRLAADGPRYKALGNSMAVNVMRWIGARITSELNSLPPETA